MDSAKIGRILKTLENWIEKELRSSLSYRIARSWWDSRDVRKALIILLAMTTCVMILQCLASADTVYLKSGKKIEGKVTETEGGVSIRTKAGFTIPMRRANIEKIVKEEAAKATKPGVRVGKKATGGYRHVAPWGSVTATESAQITLNGKPIHKAKKGDSFVAQTIKGDYYLVSTFVGGKEMGGWISGRQVNWLPAGRVRATVANAPISVGGKRIANARKGAWYQVIMKEQGYYLVEVPAMKKRGWISEKQCEWGSDMEVEVAAKKAAIRQGAKVVATATKGQHLDVYAKVYGKNKGFFCLVKIVGRKGKTGWLRAEQATLPRLKPGRASK